MGKFTRLVAGELVSFDESGPSFIPPKVTVLTTGSGTWSRTGNPVYIRVRIAAPGGGGGPSGNSIVNGGSGGNTTFGSSLLTTTGGAGGTGASGPGGSGGGFTVNSPAIDIGSFNGSHGQGGAAATNTAMGGNGGPTGFGVYGSGGAVANNGDVAPANSGGGGGGGGSAGINGSGGGGGGGGFIDAIIVNPDASYAYSIGVGGTAGTASSCNGATGADGKIEITEYYQGEAGVGGFSLTSVQTGNYSANFSELIPTDASGGAFNVTLPTSVGHASGKIKIFKTDITTNAISIVTTSGQTVGARASGDVKLRQVGDWVEVVADGTNWLIIGKQETQYMDSSNSEALSVIGVSGNYGLLATSVALTYGIWELEMQVHLNTASGVAVALISGTGLYNADGGNSGTTPSALTNVISGDSILGTTFGGAITTNGVGANSRYPGQHLKTVIATASAQTVYAVPQIDFSTTGGSSVVMKLRAKRIW